MTKVVFGSKLGAKETVPMRPNHAAVLCSIFLFSGAFGIAPAGAQAPPLPANATLYAGNLNGPRGLVFGSDGTLYVAEAGTGGTVSTVGTCIQTPPPIGPYLGGTAARISAVDSHGNRTTLASGFPSAIAAEGDLFGVADLAFLDGKLYALLTGGGCSHGNPTLPNGIVKVNLNNGKWSYITDLSLFYLQHPTAYPDPDDFEPDGVPYSLIAYNDLLYAVEPNHGQVTETTTDGSTKEAIDLSFSQAHIVPTSIVARNGDLYLGNLGQFPIQQTFQRVITLSQHLGFIDTMPGLETKPTDLNKFRVANSRAGFTTIVSLKLGPDGLLYALELSDADGFPGLGNGKVIRLKTDGTLQEVVTGLSVPTGMAFGPDHALYVSNLGAAPAGQGQILRITLP
jgi:hypothetical protein